MQQLTVLQRPLRVRLDARRCSALVSHALSCLSPPNAHVTTALSGWRDDRWPPRRLRSRVLRPETIIEEDSFEFGQQTRGQYPGREADERTLGIRAQLSRRDVSGAGSVQHPATGASCRPCRHEAPAKARLKPLSAVVAPALIVGRVARTARAVERLEGVVARAIRSIAVVAPPCMRISAR
ncbi:hypothetical protein M728_001880 [Ensifer sp. WSM1721]